MSIICIFGEPGKGKTSLMVHLLNLSNFDFTRFNNCINGLLEISEKFGIEFINAPKTHCFSNLTTLTFFKFGYSRQKCNYINPFELGFKNPYIDVNFIPPYSMVGIDEAQNYFDSRMSFYYPSWQSRYFEKHRHFDLDFFLCSQRADLIDINIRALSSFIEIQNLKVKRNKNGEVVKLVWKVREISNFKAYEKYMASNGKDKSTFTNKKIVANYDVFKCYDSQSEYCKFVEPSLYFKAEFIECVNDLDNREQLVEYLSKYNTQRPDNFYIKEFGKYGKNGTRNSA